MMTKTRMFIAVILGVMLLQGVCFADYEGVLSAGGKGKVQEQSTHAGFRAAGNANLVSGRGSHYTGLVAGGGGDRSELLVAAGPVNTGVVAGGGGDRSELLVAAGPGNTGVVAGGGGDRSDLLVAAGPVNTGVVAGGGGDRSELLVAVGPVNTGVVAGGAGDSTLVSRSPYHIEKEEIEELFK